MIKIQHLDHHPDIKQGIISSQNDSHHIIITKLNHSISFFYRETRLFNTHDALLLVEKDYPPVVYVPKSDIFQRYFLASSRTSFCPFKGTASYWSLNVNDEIVIDAVWEYSEPEQQVQSIKDHIAFPNYQNKGEFLIY